MKPEIEPLNQHPNHEPEVLENPSLHTLLVQILANRNESFNLLFPLTYGEWEAQERYYQQMEAMTFDEDETK